MAFELYDHQKKAVEELANGKILYGDVGTGKSAVAMGYYIKKEAPRNIVVITTAKKRDGLDWIKEAARVGVGREPSKFYGSITVDSWNNIYRYMNLEDHFFIFDEQRVVGNGSWVNHFIKIARKNHWILLSATPGDNWLDYIPVFLANGFYKNRTEFKLKHVVYEPFTKYPKVRGYLGVQKLEVLRNSILVEMPYFKHTERIENLMDVSHDKDLMHTIFVSRWNPFEDRPTKDIAEVFRLMRRVANTDPSRLETLKTLMKAHPKLIVFYNFDYELEILRTLKGSKVKGQTVEVAEWNGHKKEEIPKSDRWVYLVQYVAGAEGWNCIETDAMVLYSLTYSYKNFEQVKGRIDRLNTPFTKLYYYVFLSNSAIDRAIKLALDKKEAFNERKFVKVMGLFEDFDDPF